VPHIFGGHLSEAYLHSNWRLDPYSHLATIDVGRKVGAVPVPLSREGELSNTMSPGSRPSVPTGTLIHPSVWPQ